MCNWKGILDKQQKVIFKSLIYKEQTKYTCKSRINLFIDFFYNTSKREIPATLSQQYYNKPATQRRIYMKSVYSTVCFYEIKLY